MACTLAEVPSRCLTDTSSRYAQITRVSVYQDRGASPRINSSQAQRRGSGGAMLGLLSAASPCHVGGASADCDTPVRSSCGGITRERATCRPRVTEPISLRIRNSQLPGRSTLRLDGLLSWQQSVRVVSRRALSTAHAAGRKAPILCFLDPSSNSGGPSSAARPRQCAVTSRHCISYRRPDLGHAPSCRPHLHLHVIITPRHKQPSDLLVLKS